MWVENYLSLEDKKGKVKSNVFYKHAESGSEIIANAGSGTEKKRKKFVSITLQQRLLCASYSLFVAFSRTLMMLCQVDDQVLD